MWLGGFFFSASRNAGDASGVARSEAAARPSFDYQITQALLDAGYSEREIASIWGGNVLRVLRVLREAQSLAAPATCGEAG